VVKLDQVTYPGCIRRAISVPFAIETLFVLFQYFLDGFPSAETGKQSESQRN
jgi:hypothetical protein